MGKKSKLITNVVKKPFTFRVTFKSGSVDYQTIEAESESAALLILQSICEYEKAELIEE